MPPAAARTASALRLLSHAARRPQPAAATARAAPRAFSTTVPSLLASPASSSSSSSAYPSSNTHLYAPSPASQHSFLLALLPADTLPNKAVLSTEVAEKALTHKSGVDKSSLYRRARVGEDHLGQDEGGRKGHNEKLAFVGRRVLRMHMTQHLFSRLSSSHPSLLSTVLTSAARSPLSLDSILDTKQLGATVGKAWRLEDALRWREQRGPDGEMTGLWKCRGTGVEGVLGAVYTTQGVAASSALFEQLVLPHLDFPRTLSQALSGAPAPSAPSPALGEAAQPRLTPDEQIPA
ncbi:hypothetical protein Rhopal_005558-T1 [Rhodotorula paludigena]|uniref:RNase III domain-containing protein n=1 Tax=Rhodotorula paludigena TaxID=86838 RepID=A0AAV5GVB3_9BASI|nr:hypothetical protein Rhopal_005558-T1 [Rhodotorula paludigena]